MNNVRKCLDCGSKCIWVDSLTNNPYCAECLNFNITTEKSKEIK